jgi:hypothetical protein
VIALAGVLIMADSRSDEPIVEQTVNILAEMSISYNKPYGVIFE